MKRTSVAKRLTLFFTITLTLSFIGIISYISNNPAAAKTYFRRDLLYRQSDDHYDWLDYIPFINDELKDFVQTEIDDAIHDSIEMAKEHKDDWKDWGNNWKNYMDDWKNNFHTWKNDFKGRLDLINYTKASDTIVHKVSSEKIKEIEIMTDVSNLRFVEENRDDIQVTYAYTKPDSESVSLAYGVEVKDDTLIIEQHIKTKNFSGSLDKRKFQNDITVHVPKDFRVDKLIYGNEFGEIVDNAFYSRVNDLELRASLGDIDIGLVDEVHHVKLTASAGEITLHNDADIDNLYILANQGSIRLNHTGNINALIMDADMGKITVDADGIVNTCTLEANLGSMRASFKKEVGAFNLNCDMGSIDLTLYDNDDAVIDTNVSMGKVTSDFAEGRSDYYTVKSAMGSIRIRKK